MHFLYLSEDEMIKAGVTDMAACMDSMESMFELLRVEDYRMSGENNNDHGARVKFPKTSNLKNMPLAAADRWFTAMPAYLGGKYHMVGIKCYGSNHENAKKGLPRSILMMSLLDVETGAPVAYMSANIMSAMRTGAVAGLGAKYLAPDNVKRVAIIGPGTMSRYALDSIMIACPNLENISVFGRGEENLTRFEKHCAEKGYNFKEYKVCKTVKDVCADADIIFTGNSRSEKFEDNPYINEKFVKKGALIIASSAVRYDKSFLDDESKCVCVADDDKMYAEDFGVDGKPTIKESENTQTFNVALTDKYVNGKKIINLADIIADHDFYRDENKIYIYGAYGLPTEDVAWGYECYKKALELGIGTKLKVWDKPGL